MVVIDDEARLLLAFRRARALGLGSEFMDAMRILVGENSSPKELTGEPSGESVSPDECTLNPPIE